MCKKYRHVSFGLAARTRSWGSIAWMIFGEDLGTIGRAPSIFLLGKGNLGSYFEACWKPHHRHGKPWKPVDFKKDRSPLLILLRIHRFPWFPMPAMWFPACFVLVSSVSQEGRRCDKGKFWAFTHIWGLALIFPPRSHKTYTPRVRTHGTK